MYADFYNLKEKPFNLSPSSRFLYLGETHKEALALLSYGVQERKGFVLLTGEVGTGKTTIIHALLAGLDQDVHLLHLSNPLISPSEFLDYLARKALGRETPFHSKAEFLIAFETFLRNCLESRKNFLLIIDEAHKLSFELLEEIRLLSNMETAEEKLINIFLVGQPELKERLAHPRSRALFQRITIHYHLEPLDQKSVAEYIRTRLRVAGAEEPNDIFPESVINEIYQYSKGYPREINNMADNLLLLGYVQDTKRITPEIVAECRKHMTLDAPPPEQEEEISEPPKAREEALRSLSSPLFLSALILFVLGVIVGLAVGLVGNVMGGRNATVILQEKQNLAGIEQRSAPVREREATEDLPHAQSEEVAAADAAESPQGVGSKQTEAPRAEVDPPGDTKMGDAGKDPIASDVQPEVTRPSSGLESRPRHASWQTVTVREGETLRELALDVYGQGDQSTLDLLKQENPAIRDVDLILVGQRIAFPPLSMLEHKPDDLNSRHAPNSEGAD
jgi:type II secretory pathway predicted ATPase ExeA